MNQHKDVLSPDGSHIDVHTMNGDGVTVVPLCTHGGAASCPLWRRIGEEGLFGTTVLVMS